MYNDMGLVEIIFSILRTKKSDLKKFSTVHPKVHKCVEKFCEKKTFFFFRTKKTRTSLRSPEKKRQIISRLRQRYSPPISGLHIRFNGCVQNEMRGRDDFDLFQYFRIGYCIGRSSW
jgi:hypothetical protein